jgi:hypothetical protein
MAQTPLIREKVALFTDSGIERREQWVKIGGFSTKGGDSLSSAKEGVLNKHLYTDSDKDYATDDFGSLS